jgi:hypothetical protein
LNVEAYSAGNKVAIGKLDTDTTKDSEHGGRVIDANKQFVVYEDGHMKATGATFSGTIEAANSYIGDMKVSDIVNTTQAVKKLDISENLGYTFKVGKNGECAPAVLSFEAKGIGFELDKQKVVWRGTPDFENWEPEPLSTGLKCELAYSELAGLKYPPTTGTYFL